MFEGFVVGKDRIHIPIVQFADDALLFCKFDEKMMENLRKTLQSLNGVPVKRLIGRNQLFVV